ncbi:hypothetical protein L1987_49608 [Smallanthus sonchifolius]|uniref:Uncharacterized protein n=1 Tax=Smallanthus sonchifolius TaxID=185202 RepID=A0ACB9FW65_9ASTR|nr:hypothetical protein L1987_49608 [Smallanthus sonchifolius]
MQPSLGKSGIRATYWKIHRKPRRNPNQELEECSNRVAGRKNRFKGKLFSQKGRHGFKGNQQSVVRESRKNLIQRGSTRVRLSNLSLDGGKRGKPHHSESRKNLIAKKMVRKAWDFIRKSKNNSTKPFTFIELLGVQQNHEQVMINKESFKSEFVHMVEWFYPEYIGFIFHRPNTRIIKDNYEIDLLDLYLLVEARGGFRAVCRNQKWQEIATHMGLPYHLDINLRIIYMRYLNLIEYYHQNAKERRDMESYDNSCMDDVISEAVRAETVDGSPNFKRRRVQAIRDFPPMCGPDFGFANFTISGTKSRPVTPEFEQEKESETEVYCENQAIALDARIAGSEMYEVTCGISTE